MEAPGRPRPAGTWLGVQATVLISLGDPFNLQAPLAPH